MSNRVPMLGMNPLATATATAAATGNRRAANTGRTSRHTASAKRNHRCQYGEPRSSEKRPSTRHTTTDQITLKTTYGTSSRVTTRPPSRRVSGSALAKTPDTRANRGMWKA